MLLPEPADADVDRASDVATDFIMLGLALGAEIPNEEKPATLMVMEYVWNCGFKGYGSEFVESLLGSEFESEPWVRFIRTTHAARRGRFGEHDFMVFVLRGGIEDRRILFRCDVMWPEYEGIFPLTMELKPAFDLDEALAKSDSLRAAHKRAAGKGR